jgi:hypothetical protein
MLVLPTAAAPTHAISSTAVCHQVLPLYCYHWITAAAAAVAACALKFTAPPRMQLCLFLLPIHLAPANPESAADDESPLS